MFLSFIIQEQGENTKELQYEGNYTTNDLEKVYLDLIDTTTEWLKFDSRPNGFITRKSHIKSVLLREGRTE